MPLRGLSDAEHAIQTARTDYVAGKIDLSRFEEAVSQILDGTDRWYTTPFEQFYTELR
jgi:uncharacterized Rmd1/YagE family protein